MTEHTLSMERMRDLYSWAYAWRSKDSARDGEADLSGLRDSNRAEFDRSLAAHDAALEAAVRADQIEKDTEIAEAQMEKWGIHEEGWPHSAMEPIPEAIRAQLTAGENDV